MEYPHNVTYLPNLLFTQNWKTFLGCRCCLWLMMCITFIVASRHNTDKCMNVTWITYKERSFPKLLDTRNWVNIWVISHPIFVWMLMMGCCASIVIRNLTNYIPNLICLKLAWFGTLSSLSFGQYAYNFT